MDPAVNPDPQSRPSGSARSGRTAKSANANANGGAARSARSARSTGSTRGSGSAPRDEAAAGSEHDDTVADTMEFEDADFGISAVPPKPLLRGWIHLGTLPVAIALGVVLTVLAKGTALTWACAVFLATSTLLFGISALYHRVNWSPRMTALMRRLDHSNIFLLIAGTYTPMTVAALKPPGSMVLLVIVWSGALLGIMFRLFWLSAPRWLYVVLYIVLGWTAVWFVGDLIEVDPVAVSLVVAGGLAYTGGAVVYGFKRPNPAPGVYGFHEVFHTCTVVAFACHWAAMLLFVLGS